MSFASITTFMLRSKNGVTLVFGLLHLWLLQRQIFVKYFRKFRKLWSKGLVWFFPYLETIHFLKVQKYFALELHFRLFWFQPVESCYTSFFEMNYIFWFLSVSHKNGWRPVTVRIFEQKSICLRGNRFFWNTDFSKIETTLSQTHFDFIELNTYASVKSKNPSFFKWTPWIHSKKLPL